MLSGLIVTTIMIFITFIISVISYKKNMDPDNVTIPVVTGIVDLVGIISLIVVLSIFHVF